EQVLERDRQPVDARAAHAAAAQRVGVIGVGARRILVDLEEGARSFAIGGGDTRERALDELAARSAPGDKGAGELGYSPHRAGILCAGTSRAYFSAAAAFSAPAPRASCSAAPATPTCRASRARSARAARWNRRAASSAGAA